MLTNEQKELCRRLREDIDVHDADAIAAADLIEALAAHTAGAQDPVAIPDGWMLVKRERIEEIREYARTEFVNSYLGRNLYDERSLMRNERIGEEALSNIRDELQCIEEDEKERIAAHPQSMPQTDAAREVIDYETALRGCRILSNIVSAYEEGNHGGRVIHLIGVAKSWFAEIGRIDRAKGE